MASKEQAQDRIVKISHAGDNPEAEIGCLDELEVDLDSTLKEDEKYDYGSEHSPFAEVRAVVPETDDPHMPVNTLRMWMLGVVFTILGSGINQFFSLRYPSVHIVSLVAELLAYPCGVFLAKILPVTTINCGWLGSFCINPDRHFNIKEHAIIVIMSNVSFGYGSADSTNIIQASSSNFYNFGLKAGFSVLVVICAQLLGFGIAGLAAPWLVEPASIIWPGVLSNCAMLETLHSRANSVADGWKISRLRFFLYVTAAGFLWYFFPGLIFTALSYFTWICWIAPKNVIVNQLFGMQTGLGLSPITFDWSQVAYNTNPLLSPSWAAVNVFAGFAIFFWGVVPALYYTNTWYTAYLPMMTADVYDRTGAVYDTARVVSSQKTLDIDAYKQYSPPYLGATFAFVYGLAFASITSVLTHIAVWQKNDIWAAMKGKNRLDIHARLMKSYRKTPWYWYAAVIVVVTAIAIVLVEVYETKLPVYGVFLALIIPALYMVPCGIVQGITNVDANQLNVLSEFIGGYMFEGKPLANMLFKILSTDVVGQGVYFAMDMKLGHYLKIPPRLLFVAQGTATILGALTQAGVTLWMLANIDGICTEDQPDGFSCPNGRTVYSSSVIWGLVGPRRLYSAGKIYSSLLHFFWIGALAPLVTYFLYRYTKRSIFKSMNWPLIFVGTWNVPPATGINYSSWALVNFAFNHVIKRRFFAWWTKYNYVLAAALDTGLALSGIVIFFCISYPGAVFPDWWGNTVYLNTADGQGVAWKPMPDVGYFGLPNGTWT
ncbi:glutathione transporter 1 [Aspergillus lentulus]|uniref:Glutathione transporter 1 n=1 Tax=Aspergillus lentulus TaxID=293939 RepID=A0ABQ1AHQ5_ASPLE|nr:glutathione transporter 1 [Aspergillus lentulus]GFF31296.1 glutathione transporter 1 [Aspergillus lentulus]GFF82105.1 glutathione transporter 1 [Aspergillus lentulus]GFF86041.1 glutathione transporter 1 [Aspergillus lentulus]